MSAVPRLASAVTENIWRNILPEDALESRCLMALCRENLRADDAQLLRDLLLFGKEDPQNALLMIPLFLAEREGSLCYTLEQASIEKICARSLHICARPDAEDDEEVKITEEDIARFADMVMRSSERIRGDSCLFSVIESDIPEKLHPVVLYRAHPAAPQRVYWQRYFKAERALETVFRGRAAFSARQITARDAEAYCTRAGAFQNMQLNNEQQQAISLALRRNTLIISGGPGTGKTTTVAAILRALFAAGLQDPQKIMLTAPTGRAAWRMQESLREQSRRMTDLSQSEQEFFAGLSSATMHRLLENSRHGLGFRRSRKYPLKADILIVDETSMVDAELMLFLLDALPENCRLILIGDRDQLPSVSAGAVFSSILPELAALSDDAQDGIGYIHLETNTRSVEAIGRAAACCRLGRAEDFLECVPETSLREYAQMPLARISWPEKARAKGFAELIRTWLDRAFSPEINGGDYFPLLREAIDATDSARRQDLISRLLDILGTMRILVFTHHSLAGLESCNQAASAWLQSGLKQRGLASRAAISMRGKIFVSGMPVLITENDHKRRLWNGDIGVLLGDKVWFRSNTMDAAEEMRSFPLADLPNSDIAFAITVHKSQGSEYDRVLVIFPEQPTLRLLVRQIVYTAITRAKREALLCGADKIISIAISRSIERESGMTLTPRGL
ncbi:MAG: exodeoxyribonuclease V subunit alpha [Spirochaetota bacterium]|jgi:exodeoxyribonuclease V alpha subunit|nr:exodeoxyribonuclease V subunit alpha [Spirochaetota bacterium]